MGLIWFLFFLNGQFWGKTAGLRSFEGLIFRTIFIILVCCHGPTPMRSEPLFSKAGAFSVVLAVSLFVAGGIGNLMDRIFHGGSVADFLNVGVGPLRTGIFNIADVAIMGGVLVLIFFVCCKQKRVGKPPNCQLI
jgi:lipoprotein signal peptidase